jgi:hypothetical protein
MPAQLVPFYLMPIAALLGLYALTAGFKVVHLMYANATKQQPQRKVSARERLLQQQHKGTVVPLQSREFALLFLSFLLSLIAYAFVVARVEAGFLKAERALFDPYALLGLNSNEMYNATTIVEVFKNVVKQQSGATESAMEDIKFAYQALADERGMLNYKKYGHPLGALEVDAFNMKIPSWLLVPAGPYRAGVYVLYGLSVLFWLSAVVQAYRRYQLEKQLQAESARTKSDEEKAKAAGAMLDDSNSVSQGDLAFMMNQLKPTSDYHDILFGICAAPDTIAWGLRQLEKVEEIKKERKEKEAAKRDEGTLKKKDDVDLGALLDEGGWDDEGTDEGTKSLEERKTELKAVTGQAVQLLEGVDEGVLGQTWVENALAKVNQWPPSAVAVLKNVSFEYKGEIVKDFLDHPGLRRVLCMTMGRLNSHLLNGHPQLLAAGANKLIDQTYFKGSMEFRQRAGLLLEGTLRLSMMLRSYRLVHTVLKTVALFRIGCHDTPEALKLFETMMQRQNNCLPRLEVHSKAITSVGHSEIATGDKCELEVDMERLHAENFLKAKVAICQQQGIPPQVALQAYREGWWLLLRCKRLDGPTPAQPLSVDILRNLKIDDSQIELFQKEDPEYHLLSAIPVIVSNVAQQRGKFQVKFTAPLEAGKYRFFLTIKSQDFLGADQEIELTETVVAASSVGREAASESDEPKKEK